MRAASLLLLALLLCPPAANGAEDGVRALVRKAIQARGGEEQILLSRTMHLEVRGNFIGSGQVRGDVYLDADGRNRLDYRFAQEEHSYSWVSVFDGQRGWTSTDGETASRDEQSLAETAQRAWTDRLMTLVPLLHDRGLRLESLGKSTVDTTIVEGIRVKAPGRPEVQLWFEEASGLLLKAECWLASDYAPTRTVAVLLRDYHRPDHAAQAERFLASRGRDASPDELARLLREQARLAADPEPIQVLIERLGSSAYREREEASERLTALGAPAIKSLRQAAASGDAEIASRARRCLDLIDRRGQGPDGLSAAVRVLAARRPGGAVEAIAAWLPHAPTPEAAREMQSALVELGHRQVLAALAGLELAADAPGRRLYLAGIRMPRRMIYQDDGVTTGELEVEAIHFYNRLDDSLFLKP